HIEGDTIIDTKLRLNDSRGGRECLVWRRGSQNDEIDLTGCYPRHLQRPARGVSPQRGRGFTLACNITLTDTGALDDPGVARIHRLRQFGIVDTAARQGRAGSQYHGPQGHLAISSSLAI